MSNVTDNPIAPGSNDPVDEVLLSRYLEGRLDETERRALEELLRTNAAARRRLDALREEERLLREALETLSEPSVRLSDAIIAKLHAEERARCQAVRVQRVRRHVFTVLAAAASLLLCVWLVRPRDAAGTLVSGTAASLTTPAGDRRVLNKDSRVYEGDRIGAALGQFVRLRLAGDAILDIDEQTRLLIARSRPAPALELEAGRIGVRTEREDVQVHVPQGVVRVAPGSLVDIWLPRPAEIAWPGALEPLASVASAPAAATAELPAVVTVLAGAADVTNAMPAGTVTVSGGGRAVFQNATRSIVAVDLRRSRALDVRQGRSWHALDGVAPEGRAVIGLLDQPDFADLGRRLRMTDGAPQQVVQAVAEPLAQLQAAMRATDAAQRAEQLAAAQQALREACAPLKAGDERRAFGRVLEGLAHLERGRALVAPPAGSDVTRLLAAAAAFDAARVAFEEALKTETETGADQADGKPLWARQIAEGPSVTIRELSPANQSALLAAFNHAVARYWLARTQAAALSVASGEAAAIEPAAVRTLAQEAAKELNAVGALLGRSVEAVAARLAESLALEAAAAIPDGDAKTLRAKAVQTFGEVLDTPLAGWNEPARRYGDGIRQAALLALVRTHLTVGDMTEAGTAAADFNLLYPLADATAPARQIRGLLSVYLLKEAVAAMQAGRWREGVEACDQWLNQPAFAAAQDEALGVRMQRIKALIALKDIARAREAAAELEAMKDLPAARKAEVQALARQAETLAAPAR
jgi:hypothetical protein